MLFHAIETPPAPITGLGKLEGTWMLLARIHSLDALCGEWDSTDIGRALLPQPFGKKQDAKHRAGFWPDTRHPLKLSFMGHPPCAFFVFVQYEGCLPQPLVPSPFARPRLAFLTRSSRLCQHEGEEWCHLCPPNHSMATAERCELNGAFVNH